MRFVLVLLVGVVAVSCEWKDPSEELIDPNIRIVKDINGNVKSRFTMKDSLIHGPATVYYEGGKVISSTVTYRNNKKDGLEKKFYKSGELYSTRNYEKGKLQGIERRYYKNGQLRTEVNYRDSRPAVGLKEYSMSGEPVVEYPELKMRQSLTSDGLIKLEFFFEGHPRVVTFYEGNLIEGKYFDRDAIPLGEIDGVGEKLLYRGEKSEITVSARLTTRNNAPYITAKTFVLE